MRLTRLRLVRTPGIATPFTLEPNPGFNLVTGPNGVGKSSVCRAVLSLLWPAMIREEPFAAEALFETDRGPMRVSRRDSEPPVWEGGPRPNLGPEHLSGRYLLGVLDLARPEPGDDPLAREIRKHMAGGFDVESLRKGLFPARTGRSETANLKTADAVVTRLKNEQQSLVFEQDRLESLRGERDLASTARDRLAALETLRNLSRQTAARDEALARLEPLPEACARTRPDDPATLADLRHREREHLQEIAARETSLSANEVELAEFKASETGSADLSLGLLRKKLANLAELKGDVRQAEREAGGPRLEEVLAEASETPSLPPVIVMLTVGAGLMVAGIFLPVPGPSWPWLVVGGGAVGAGLFGLAQYFRGAGQARQALDKKQALAQAQDRLSDCRTRLDEALATFNEELPENGAAPVVDVDEAAQRLDDLADRRDRVKTLEAGRKTDADFLARERRHLDRVQADLADLMERLGLDNEPRNDAEVSRLLDLLPRFEEAVRERDDAQREISRLTGLLGEQGGLLREEETAAMSAGALSALIEKEKQLADKWAALVSEIAGIEEKIALTRKRHDLQEADATRDSARAALADCRQGNRAAALGRLLLGRVEHQHELESRPVVLEKADGYFRTFTNGRSGLTLAPQGRGEDRFLALTEDSVTPLELDELSDGTRAQLLLAVKLAFVTAGEEGERPPIFLDDSLSSADPERFAAVAASLGRLVEQDGRQIFYLTPNPVDAAAIGRALTAAGLPQAHHLDLAEVRAVSGRTDPALLDPGSLPDLGLAPDPAGLTPAEFAGLLRVPSPDPWARPETLHVFFVLEDNLDLVCRLVDGNAPTLGRFAHSRDTLIAAGIVSGDEAHRIAAGADLWSAWLAGWRIGRAQPVPAIFLKNSPAVSDKFIKPMLEVLTSCAGDGAGLLAAIEEKKVKGFRANKLEELRRELDDADLLARGTPMTDDELITHTLDRVAPHLAAGLLDMQKVRTLALTFARLVDS